MKRFLHFGSLLALIVLIGCTSLPSSATPTATHLPTSSPTITRTPTIPPTLTNTLTLSPTITPTLTLFPTLPASEATSKVQEYFQNGSTCSLPCWMGIVPGQSTWPDLANLQSALSSIATGVYPKDEVGDSFIGEFSLRFTNSTATIDIRSTFLGLTPIWGPAAGKTIAVNAVDTMAYNPNSDPLQELYRYAPYNEMLHAYFLPAILSKYGVPDGVYTLASLRHDLGVTPAFGDYFLIHVVYPEKGILMEYQLKPTGDGNYYRICPADAWIGIYLTAPDLGPGFGKALAEIDNKFTYLTDPSLQKGEDVEKAFGMSLDAFTQTFVSNPIRCLETPKSLWYQ